MRQLRKSGSVERVGSNAHSYSDPAVRHGSALPLMRALNLKLRTCTRLMRIDSPN